MEPAKKNQPQYTLIMRAITWYKDSHSLFDYQSTKTTSTTFSYPLLETKGVALYRKRNTCQVEAQSFSDKEEFDRDSYQLLTKIGLKITPKNKVKLNFLNKSQKSPLKAKSDRVNTQESFSSVTSIEEEAYLIVRKNKQNGIQPKGYRLEAGQHIKLGRVEYFISEVCINGKVQNASNNHKKIYSNRKVMKYDRKKFQQDVAELEEKPACKICLEEVDSDENYMLKPCICSGSCGSVHVDCFQQWIHYRVKKQVVGGTNHYNFQKFQCEVCKTELPIIIQESNGTFKQIITIHRPTTNYIILQGACQKSKSVMVITNISPDGIKLGRGHDCQIRITDISVSRNHAFLKYMSDGFYIFDNKSKFGTLVKDETMSMELNRAGQGIQIGRTVITFDLKRQNSKEGKEPKEGKEVKEGKEIKQIEGKSYNSQSLIRVRGQKSTQQRLV